MKHKICYHAGRPECHICATPCYSENEEDIQKWIKEMEEAECEEK